MTARTLTFKISNNTNNSNNSNIVDYIDLIHYLIVFF